ncbi:hypothetical protein Tco_0465081 [Tanacetum coccineum]
MCDSRDAFSSLVFPLIQKVSENNLEVLKAPKKNLEVLKVILPHKISTSSILSFWLLHNDRGGGECGGGCEDKNVYVIVRIGSAFMVLGRKQRGHLSGRGKKVAEVGTSTVFGSQDEGTPFYSQREMNEVVKKYQEDLAAQQKAIGQQSENFQRMLEFLS